MESMESMALVEKASGQPWVWKKQHQLDHLKNPVPPAELPSNARLDDDMISSLKNSDDAEKSTGQHWTGDGQYA